MNSTNPPPTENQSPIRVLIVDDIPHVRQELRLLLELTGLFEVAGEAGNGMEAVQQASELSPDAVLMDLAMPGLDGYEATRQIKAQNPAIRVIILSAYAGPEEIKCAQASGADGFVMKGASYEVLVDAIQGENRSSNSFDTKKGQGS